MSFSAARGFAANAAVLPATQWAAKCMCYLYTATLERTASAQHCAILHASALRAANHTVEVRDLYAEGFVPTMSADERGRYYGDPSTSTGSKNIYRLCNALTRCCWSIQPGGSVCRQCSRAGSIVSGCLAWPSVSAGLGVSNRF